MVLNVQHAADGWLFGWLLSSALCRRLCHLVACFCFPVIQEL
jgi:hypothetical protein